MQATADSLAFAPPPEPAAVRGFVLAVIAHLLLVVALSLGINWDKDTPAVAVEAELWSATPQQAAPPPPPPPAPTPVVQAPPVIQAPPPQVAKQPDIAIEREKKRKEQEAKRRIEEEQQRKQLEAQRRKLEEQQRLADEKRLRDAEEKKQRLAEERKLREEQAKKDKLKKELDAKKLEQLRKENLARLMNEAAGSGAQSSTGTAAKSSGPSDSYAGRIRARVKPNIVFTEDVPGNPLAEVEVRMAPDGTITARKITKSSGVKSWDEAVLRALDKTEVLPRDIDGRVHTPLIIEFRPRG